jgi:hypothetical protein
MPRPPRFLRESSTADVPFPEGPLQPSDPFALRSQQTMPDYKCWLPFQIGRKNDVVTRAALLNESELGRDSRAIASNQSRYDGT